MRKKAYPSRLEPRLRAAILCLGLMPDEDLTRARRDAHRSCGGGFHWPEFLALGPGAYIASWNPPDIRGLAEWITTRARHYSAALDVSVEGDPTGGGAIEFRSGPYSARREWRRGAQAYRACEATFEEIERSAALGLSLLQLEPHGEQFEWVMFRTEDRALFDAHLRSERDWHSAVSKANQRFTEAGQAGDREGQLQAAREGVVAGEWMRRLGGDVSHHTREVADMYELLGNRRAAARWRRYPYRSVPYGMMRHGHANK